MNVIPLSLVDLSLSASLVLALAALSWQQKLGLERSLLINMLRMVIQLSLIGLVLKVLFANAELLFVAALAFVMLLIAGREVMVRQERRFSGLWGYALGTSSMFVSSFTVTVLALAVMIGTDPWYDPRYAIPLLGMLLGNTMSGISLGLDRLTSGAWNGRLVIEARLALGETAMQAISDARREAIRVGLIPIVNTMAAAGVVSLPGMMTGQILSGTAPMEAVNYQILILLLITAGTGFGTALAVSFGARRLFDERERLRLDRLTPGRKHQKKKKA